jgi:hypothetical protein
MTHEELNCIEANADAQDARIAEAIARLNYELGTGDLRPYSGYKEILNFAFEAMSECARQSNIDPEEIFETARERLSAEAVGHLLLQLIGPEVDQDRFSRQGKEMAMTVAEILGPDHAQSLYRFAVLVTRLA